MHVLTFDVSAGKLSERNKLKVKKQKKKMIMRSKFKVKPTIGVKVKMIGVRVQMIGVMMRMMTMLMTKKRIKRLTILILLLLKRTLIIQRKN